MDATVMSEEFTDTFLIYLANTAEFISTTYIRVIFDPVVNPPSMKPVTGFEIRTMDSEENIIDQLTGVSYTNAFPNEFLKTTEKFSNISADKTMVEETEVTLTITLYPTNDIPYNAYIYIYWYEAWTEIDCTPTYMV